MNSCRRSAWLVAMLIPVCAWGVDPAQSPTGPSPSVTAAGRAELSRVLEPPELKNMPTPTPVSPSPVASAFFNSKALPKADPDHPETLPPALRDLQSLIQQYPNRSDLYLLRATLSCFVHVDPTALLSDLNKSIELHDASDSAYKSLIDHYALRAKINLNTGHGAQALADLDRAMKEDYDFAADIFNDGKVQPTKGPKPCTWTLPDLDVLAKQFPNDSRPLLYRGIYLTFFTRYKTDSDFRPILSAFEQAAKIDPKSALPHFYLGRLYVSDGLGGLFSMTSAKCLDYVVPRTKDCLAMDQAHETGVQDLTAAIALDPAFAPAYALRAEGFLKLKSYRQAIRDYSKALDLDTRSEERRMLLNDRSQAKTNLGLYTEAIEDLSAAIKIGCPANDTTCDQYENRANAFAQLGNYQHAIDDLSMAIRGHLEVMYLTGIQQFRRIYPEYDSVSDDVLCDLLRRRLNPQMSYLDFAGQFLVKAKGFDEFIIADLYVKRGDWYQKLGQHRKARQEYDRVIKGYPSLANSSFTQVNGQWVRNSE